MEGEFQGRKLENKKCNCNFVCADCRPLLASTIIYFILYILLKNFNKKYEINFSCPLRGITTNL